MNKKITILDDDYSDDKGLQDLHRKNQEELERINMPPMPLNEKGIDAETALRKAITNYRKELEG